jgi:TIR domain
MSQGDSRPVFLSFRREDTEARAKRLCAALTERLRDRDQVLFDFLDDPVDWVGELIETVRRSRIVLVLIGAVWTESMAERRSFSDPVHIELEAALRHEIPLLAVLMEAASLPKPASLPPGLSVIAQIPSVRLRASYWQRDLDALVEAIERHGLAT